MTDIDLGYLTTPTGIGPWPGVVLIHEVFGLDDVMRRHADRLASAGYLTLAVDLFQSGNALKCLVSTMTAMVRGRGQAFTDIEAARQYLATSDSCTGKIGVIGFCMGGGFALLLANTGYDAAAVNYGMLPRQLDTAVVNACPIVGSYGRRDPLNRGAAHKLDDALGRAGIRRDIKEYPTASHAFLNDNEAGPAPMRPLFRVAGIGPDPEAAEDAWRRIDTFFAETLH